MMLGAKVSKTCELFPLIQGWRETFPLFYLPPHIKEKQEKTKTELHINIQA